MNEDTRTADSALGDAQGFLAEEGHSSAAASGAEDSADDQGQMASPPGSARGERRSRWHQDLSPLTSGVPLLVGGAQDKRIAQQ